MAAVVALCEKAMALSNGRLVDAGAASQVVEDYQRSVLRHLEFGSICRAVCSSSDTHAIGIANCEASLATNADGELDLTFRLDVFSKKACTNVGVGCQITTLNGVRICTIAPIMTNFVIDALDGSMTCQFHCQSVTRYVAGGEYTVDFWLSRPRIETLLVAENALRLSIPPSDPYKSGTNLECDRHGVVPLRATFTAQRSSP